MKRMVKMTGICLLWAGAAQAAIVYQDTFDNDTLAVNSGIGGGASVNNLVGTPYWSDDGDDSYIVPAPVGYTSDALVYSLNSFQSSGGFRLTVDYTISDIGVAAANQLSFGLVSTDTDFSTYAGINPFGGGASLYSLGVNVTADNQDGVLGNGLSFANLSTVTQLDAAGDHASFTTEPSTVVITMETDGAWSYSINGISEASGTVVGGFDLTKSYQFVAYGRDDVSTKSIQSVSLEAIPEPATLGLVGAFGVGLLFLRRFFIM